MVRVKYTGMNTHRYTRDKIYKGYELGRYVVFLNDSKHVTTLMKERMLLFEYLGEVTHTKGGKLL